MRCPSCNRFPSFEQQEPEGDLETVHGLSVSGSVTIALVSECCGEECKTAQFDCGFEIPHSAVDAHVNAAGDALEVGEDDEEHCLSVEVEYEATMRTEGKGRGMRTFYGYHATARVTCDCGTGGVLFETDDLDEDIQASHMDEVS